MDLNLSPTGGQDLFVILNIYEQENIYGCTGVLYLFFNVNYKLKY